MAERVVPLGYHVDSIVSYFFIDSIAAELKNGIFKSGEIKPNECQAKIPTVETYNDFESVVVKHDIWKLFLAKQYMKIR